MLVEGLFVMLSSFFIIIQVFLSTSSWGRVSSWWQLWSNSHMVLQIVYKDVCLNKGTWTYFSWITMTRMTENLHRLSKGFRVREGYSLLKIFALGGIGYHSRAKSLDGPVEQVSNSSWYGSFHFSLNYLN